MNSHICHYIRNGTLNILFKYDSTIPLKNVSLYGVSNAQRQLFNIDKIKQLVRVENGCTNIAASIVPTSMNRNDVASVAKDCLDHGIYPLIAELECSGDAQDYYGQLALEQQELLNLKEQINELICEEYEIPVCPAVICGMHIRYDGKVTVDEYTGLSCHWFWLQEPKTQVIADFNKDSIQDIAKRISEYRIQRLYAVKEISQTNHTSIFGGCGGNIRYLFNCYFKMIERR